MSYTTFKMKVKKEATVAVIIGLILALIVVGGVLRAQSALKNIKLPTKELFMKDKPVKDDKAIELFLDITNPDNSVTAETTIALTGKTLPSTYIAILGEKGEYLIIPNDLGVFSQEIALIKGANTIKITSYQKDGKKVEKTLSVVYTTAQL